MTQATVIKLLESYSKRILEAPHYPEEIKKAFSEYRDTKSKDSLDRYIEFFEKYQQLTDPLDTMLSHMWEEAIKKASAAGEIHETGQGNVSAIFIDMWDTVSAGGWDALADYQQDGLVQALAGLTRSSAFKSGTSPEEIVAEMCAQISEGRIPFAQWGSDIFTNFTDGSPLSLEMKGWKPTVFNGVDGKKRKPSVKLDGTVFRSKAEFPSGQVLVSDAVRVGGLGDILSDLGAERGICINYSMHRVLRTHFQAVKLGIVDVAMGGDGPDMVSDGEGGCLFAGREDDTFKQAASVCNDYWGTTLVDRKTLTDLLVSYGAEEEDVQAEIDAWLEGSHFATEIKLAPGTYHLYWDDDRVTLDAALKKAGIASPEDTRFLLSREEIDMGEAWVNNLAL